MSLVSETTRSCLRSARANVPELGDSPQGLSHCGDESRICLIAIFGPYFRASSSSKPIRAVSSLQSSTEHYEHRAPSTEHQEPTRTQSPSSIVHTQSIFCTECYQSTPSSLRRVNRVPVTRVHDIHKPNSNPSHSSPQRLNFRALFSSTEFLKRV
jgi:hypothetical protein